MDLSKHRHEFDKKAKLFNIIINIVLLTSEPLPENKKKKKALTCLNKCHFQTLLPASEYNPYCYSSKSLSQFKTIVHLGEVINLMS